MTKIAVRNIVSFLSLATLLSGCSIQKIATRSLTGVLENGNAVYETDNDPAFIAEALPFSLKLIDALLVQDPENVNLLLSAATGYVFYSYAFLVLPSEKALYDDISQARELRARARNLSLRAHEYVARALDVRYPDFGETFVEDPEAALHRIAEPTDENLEMLYWSAVSLSLAISSARNEPALLARAAEVTALLSRALTLDESWDRGALHELAISSAVLSKIDDNALLSHYERAIELSKGRRASLHISYAEAAARPQQNRAEFIQLLNRALDIDEDLHTDLRLVNVVAKQRAEWLLENLENLFLE